MQDDERPDADDDDSADLIGPERRLTVCVRGHKHDCVNDCGAHLYCPDDDRCRVKDQWMCPACLDYVDEQQVIALAKRLGREL